VDRSSLAWASADLGPAMMNKVVKTVITAILPMAGFLAIFIPIVA
jgi:hypothetical protein